MKITKKHFNIKWLDTWRNSSRWQVMALVIFLALVLRIAIFTRASNTFIFFPDGVESIISGFYFPLLIYIVILIAPKGKNIIAYVLSPITIFFFLAYLPLVAPMGFAVGSGGRITGLVFGAIIGIVLLVLLMRAVYKAFDSASSEGDY